MFEHNSLLSVLGSGGGGVLDFYHCATLGLNKAIVRPGSEGVQKDRQWLWRQKRSPCWAGPHDLVSMGQFEPTWRRFVGKVTWSLNRMLNTRILPSKRQSEWEHRGRGGLPRIEVEASCVICMCCPLHKSEWVCLWEGERGIGCQSRWEGKEGFRKSPCMQMQSGCTVHWCDSH